MAIRLKHSVALYIEQALQICSLRCKFVLSSTRQGLPFGKPVFELRHYIQVSNNFISDKPRDESKHDGETEKNQETAHKKRIYPLIHAEPAEVAKPKFNESAAWYPIQLQQQSINYINQRITTHLPCIACKAARVHFQSEETNVRELGGEPADPNFFAHLCT